MALQHLRSATANKRPTPAAMADGQLAVNTAATSPGVFFKDAAGNLVKAGPVHVGTAAPNVSPAVGGQAGNSIGELWLDTTGTDYTLKTWDGSAWREIVVTSTMIKDGTIVNADINASAAIVDTKLATITTAGKVNNSATTATNANTTNAIVSRDASGNFSAGTITAALTGAASANVLKAGDTMTGVLAVTAGTAALPAITPSGDPNTGIYSPGADQVAISTNGTGRLFITSNGDIGINQSSVTGIHGTTISATNTALGGATYRVAGFTTSAYLFTSDSLGYGGILQASAHPLIFGTNSAERMRLDTSGRLGLGSSTPDALLTVNGVGAHGLGSVTAPSFAFTGDLNTGFWSPAADTIAASTGGSERARIDSSGRLLVGTSTSISNAVEGGVQIVGTAADAYLTLTRFGGATASAPAGIVLGRSRSGTKGTNTAVSDGDFLGVVEFTGADGGTNYRSAAQIAAYVDGAVSGGGAADMPGRLVFSVTADGASSPTEAMRIKNSRIINIANTPVYADNAAAKTGGLVDGDVYRTSTGDLKIVYT